MRNFGLFITFWLASVLLPTNSFALGLGEIEVNSFLNQPLDAKIAVISARPGEVENLLVTLASRDAFTRAGLSRPRSLSELRFSVLVNEEDDSAVVLVTTKTAVKEPFLNFLVEADWAKGRVLREFTVLLDPPFYADTPAPAETSAEAPSVDVIADSESIAGSSTTPEASSSSAEPDAAAAETSVIATVPATESSSTSMQQSTTEPIAVSVENESSSVSEEIEFIADESDSMIVGDLEVYKGDTLWSIAAQFKDSEHSMSQVMLAIQRMNPESFNDNNINLLKAGTVLRAPTAEQLDRINEREALAEVLEQNGLWEGYVEFLSETTSVSVAGDGGETGTGDSSAEEPGSLSLLAPGEGESDTTGTQSDGEDSSELSRQLAFAEEELDAARIENADLESRIAELEATLSKVQELQKMVEIEDDSLAQLQADQAAEAAALEAVIMEEMAIETGMTEEATTTEETTDTLTEDLTEDLVEDLNQVDEEATIAAPPAPVIVVEPTQGSSSMLDGIIPPAAIEIVSSIGSIFQDPLLLAGLGGIVLLLFGMVMYKRWKSGREFVDMGAIDAGNDNTITESTLADDGDITPVRMADAEAEDEQPTDIMPDTQGGAIADAIEGEADGFSADEIISADNLADALVQEFPAQEPSAQEPVADQEPEVEEQDDTLNEVDVYLAYGLYDNAEELLIQSLEASPTRADYRAKLLDTYFATKNVDEFVKQAEALKGMGDSATRHWERVQVMGFELAPDNELFSGAKDSSLSASDLGIAKPEVADFDLGAGGDDETVIGETDFLLSEEPEDGLGDLEFALDADDEKAAEGDADESMDFDIDEALSLDDDEAEPEAVNVADGDEFQPTMIIRPGADLDVDGDDIFDSAAIDPGLDEASDDSDIAIMDSLDDTEFGDIDLGLDETSDDSDNAIMDSTGDTEFGDIDLGLDELSDTSSDTAIMDSIDDTEFSDIDLGMDDLSMDDDEIDGDDDGDDFLLDLDSSPAKTDTFAPGDFDDPEEFISSDSDIEGVNIDDMDDLVLPDDVDEVSTKLDLARAFIDMGDAEGARSSLDEVLKEGNQEQKAEAEDLIKQM